MLVFFSGLNCAKPLPPEPPIVETIADGSVPPGTICERACYVLKQFNCVEGRDDDAGTCVEKCNYLSQLPEVGAIYYCIANARSNFEVMTCNTKCN